MKAEPLGLAFSGDYKRLQNDSLKLAVYNDKYIKASRLFDVDNYAKSLELAYALLESNDAIILIKSNLLLGKIFEKNKDYDSSLNYFQNSLKLIEQLKIENNQNELFLNNDLKIFEADNLLEIGKVYLRKNEIDNSLLFFDRLIDIDSVDEYIFFLKGKAYNNLSYIESRGKKYDEAKVLIMKSIDLLGKTDKRKDLSMAYLNLANIYEVTGERKKALKTYFKALSYVENKIDAKSLEYREALYYNIAWTMYNLKDYKAYEYLGKSYDLKDSLLNVSLKKELKKIEHTHNIDIIRKEEENKREKLVRNNWFLGISGALVSLLFLYLANLNKLKQRSLSLQLSQKELEQNKKLEKLKSDSQAKIINATIDGKETERKIIAETLHDNVSALLSSARMHLQATQKQIKEGKLPIELEKTQQIILEASTIVRDLSHNLVSSVLLKFGLEYAIKDTAKKFSNSTIKIHTAITDVTRYDQEFEIKIYNITQEFINNILKHSKATSAYVVMEEENDYLLIIVKDNGCGFQIEKEDDNGIGLNQIEARIGAMGGVFSIESKEGEGTKIMVNIPVVPKQKPEITLA